MIKYNLAISINNLNLTFADRSNMYQILFYGCKLYFSSITKSAKLPSLDGIIAIDFITITFRLVVDCKEVVD